jgi:hypothetical protein
MAHTHRPAELIDPQVVRIIDRVRGARTKSELFAAAFDAAEAREQFPVAYELAMASLDAIVVTPSVEH